MDTATDTAAFTRVSRNISQISGNLTLTTSVITPFAMPSSKELTGKGFAHDESEAKISGGNPFVPGV